MPQKYSKDYYQSHVRPKRIAEGKIKGERKRLYNGFPTKEAKRIYDKSYRLKTRFNISLEEWEDMYKEQEGKCCICGKHFDKTPHVDHNHITGTVRGLLCFQCNSILGYAYDDVNILQNAISYLKERDRKEGFNV